MGRVHSPQPTASQAGLAGGRRMDKGQRREREREKERGRGEEESIRVERESIISRALY